MAEFPSRILIQVTGEIFLKQAPFSKNYTSGYIKRKVIYFSFYVVTKKVFLFHLEIMKYRQKHVEKSTRTAS